MKKSILGGLVICLLIFGIISPVSPTLERVAGGSGAIIKVAEAKKKTKKKKVSLKTHKKNLKYLLKKGVTRTFISSFVRIRSVVYTSVG